MFTPESEKIYFPSEYKDIEVAFLGQISSYRDYRSDYIDYASDKLKEYKTYFSTKDRVDQINHFDYARIINRSKIGLNFSRSVNMDQLKGRVLHTMLSGALLLETKNSQTDFLFEDGKEYVSFTSKEEMIDKIKFYLRNDKIREEIAKNGREKTLLNYSRKLFWDKVLEESNSLKLENA
jgi:spore maturation protein CgeB